MKELNVSCSVVILLLYVVDLWGVPVLWRSPVETSSAPRPYQKDAV
jgi:hypothetical protein